MAITLGLMAEPQQAPPAIDGASFCIACSDGSQGAMLYQYMADHAKGHTPGTILETVHGTFKSALEGARATLPTPSAPPSTGSSGSTNSWRPGPSRQWSTASI